MSVEFWGVHAVVKKLIDEHDEGGEEPDGNIEIDDANDARG